MALKGTTICAVLKDGKIAVAGDGQVTMGESTIFTATAKKVRRIYGGRVVTGFAGTVSDAFALCDRFEAKLEQFSGNMERAAVELAQEWRADKAMRKLEAMLIAACGDQLMIISGSGEVIVPDDGIAAVGSGGNYAMAAARALKENTDLSAHEIAEKALGISKDAPEISKKGRKRAVKATKEPEPINSPSEPEKPVKTEIPEKLPDDGAMDKLPWENEPEPAKPAGPTPEQMAEQAAKDNLLNDEIEL